MNINEIITIIEFKSLLSLLLFLYDWVLLYDNSLVLYQRLLFLLVGILHLVHFGFYKSPNSFCSLSNLVCCLFSILFQFSTTHLFMDFCVCLLAIIFRLLSYPCKFLFSFIKDLIWRHFCQGDILFEKLLSLLIGRLLWNFSISALFLNLSKKDSYHNSIVMCCIGSQIFFVLLLVKIKLSEKVFKFFVSSFP